MPGTQPNRAEPFETRDPRRLSSGQTLGLLRKTEPTSNGPTPSNRIPRERERGRIGNHELSDAALFCRLIELRASRICCHVDEKPGEAADRAVGVREGGTWGTSAHALLLPPVSRGAQQLLMGPTVSFLF